MAGKNTNINQAGSPDLKIDGSNAIPEQDPVAVAESRLMQSIHKELGKFPPDARGRLLLAVNRSLAVMMTLPSNGGPEKPAEPVKGVVGP